MSGRAVIVTGGANGIGWATAQRFAAAGDRVLIADIDHGLALKRAGELGKGHHACKADLGVPADVIAMIDECLRAFGRVDVLVNNAGVIDTGGTSVIDQPTEAFRRLLSINLDGTSLAACEAARQMRLQGGGVIVNVASGAALRAIPLRNGYSASKAGVVALTRNLASRLIGHDIRVNAVAPGYIRTDLVDALIRNGRVDPARAVQRIPLGRMGTPQEMAEVIFFLASPQSSYLVGGLLVADGGSQAYGGSEDVSVPRGKAPAKAPGGNKVVVIAGAMSRIGSAAARWFAQTGAQCVLLDPLPGQLAPGDDAMLAKVDFSDGVAVEAAISEVARRFGRIDAVVNAVGSDALVFDSTGLTVPQAIDEHLTGLFHVARATGRVMLAQGFGALANVTSILGQVGLSGEEGRAAGAAAVGMFTRTLACEWGSSGIRVNAVAAGLLEGAASDLLCRIPAGRAGTLEELAEVIGFVLSERAAFVNGAVIAADGGLSIYHGPDL